MIIHYSSLHTTDLLLLSLPCICHLGREEKSRLGGINFLWGEHNLKGSNARVCGSLQCCDVRGLWQQAQVVVHGVKCLLEVLRRQLLPQAYRTSDG